MLKRNHKQNLFQTIFIYFIWAVFSAFLFLLITNTYYLNILRANTQDQYVDKLENLSENLTTVFDEINSTTALFTVSDELNIALNNPGSYIYDRYTVVTKSVEALKKFNRTRDYINNVFIINKADDKVISSLGTSSIEEFFGIVSFYEKYPSNFWLNMPASDNRYDLLAPSLVGNTANNVTTKVIPIVQNKTVDQNYGNTLVVNFNNSYLQSLFDSNLLSENSIVYVYTQSDGIISRSTPKEAGDLSDSHLIELASKAKELDDTVITYNGTRYLTVFSQNTDNNYVLCAIMPYTDLTKESIKVLLLPMFIFTFGIILVLGLSFFFSRRIYSPIHRVALNIKDNMSQNDELLLTNDLDFLNQSVQRIINDNHQLKEDLNLAIPYVCERYILSLFDDNEILREDEVRDFLSNHDFSFPHNHFIVIQSTLNFKEEFFNTHSKAEYNALCQSSLLIANEAFSAIDDRYVFSEAINRICIVLNLPAENEKPKISASILKYHKSIDINEEMVTVHTGVGRLYEGLNGLKHSYTEATNASSQLTYMSKSMIRTYSQTDEAINNSYYTIDEENHLSNYLLQGDEVKVLKFLDQIINKNMNEKIGIHGIKELYLQLYNTAIRVINRKEMSIYDLMGSDYVNISSNIGELATDQLYNYIKTLFVKIMENCSKSNQQNDISQLKHYLDTNFSNEIYLDAIAEHFGKSSKYMSKYIKKSLGISFQDYVSGLRIEKAKGLLHKTDLSINAISEEVGFNSRHPFIRKFKILEGITPTEYRKLHK